MAKLRTYGQRFMAWFSEKKLFGQSSAVAMPAAVERRRVLVIIPHDKSWWAINAVQQLVTTLRDQMGYAASPQIDIVSAQANEDTLAGLLALLCQEANHELVISMGSWVARETQVFLDGMINPVPHIFCGAIDPVALGLVDSLEAPGRAVSGVATVPPNFELQVAMFQALVPQLKAIGVLFGSAIGQASVCPLVHAQLARFEAASCARGITLVPIACAAVGDIAGAVEQARQRHDLGLLCTMNDVFVSSHMESIIALGMQMRLPICASELSSVYYGAAFGFGDYGAVYGLYGASLAYEVLVNKRNLALTPVITPPIQQSLRYNYDAMVAQGLVLSSQVCHLLSMVSIFFNARQ